MTANVPDMERQKRNSRVSMPAEIGGGMNSVSLAFRNGVPASGYRNVRCLYLVSLPLDKRRRQGPRLLGRDFLTNHCAFAVLSTPDLTDVRCHSKKHVEVIPLGFGVDLSF